METTVRRIGDSTDLLGESPCWDAWAGAVWWVDSLTGLVRRLDACAKSTALSYQVPAPVGSMALCDGENIVLALKDRFALYCPESGALKDLGRIDVVDHPDVRLNDGKCDPWGNFIAGTLQLHWRVGQPVLGGLYRLTPAGCVEVLARDFGLTNGPCFSPDGTTLYVADSAIGVRTIWAFDYAPDRPLANRRVFVHTEWLGAGPDGAAVDAEGFVWSALPRIGQLARFAPDGSLDRLLRMPATHPTSLCFGGADLDRLYVTSISRGTNLVGALPDDGGLWEVQGVPARGLPVGRFGR